MAFTLQKEKGPESVKPSGPFNCSTLVRALENYAGTLPEDTARHSEACSPMQQQAQVEVANTMIVLSHAIGEAVKAKSMG
jgi:hypothetical protein